MAANYRIGPFKLDPEALILFRGADPTPLGRRAVALLCALVRTPRAPISKEALIEAAWPGLAVEDSNLTVQIAALRRILGQEPGGVHWIETLPRRGYRFLGPVEPVGAGAAVEMPPHGRAAPDRPRAAPERRQLTMVACELVADAVDLEELGAALRSFHRAVAEIAQRFDGAPARQIGHTVLIAFGYPTAHEDDPEQAVRAALALCVAVRSLMPGLTLHCRAGIATGLVIAGEPLDLPAGDIVGEAPNLATRLQSLAASDTVLIDATTRRLIGELFVCRETELIAGGVRAPAWQVVAPSAIPTRSASLPAAPLTPFVGRDDEMALLRRRWAQAKDGEGRVVLVAGEAGIGKSRIALGLQDSIGHGYVRLRYFCSPHHANSALYPFLAQLNETLAFEPDASPAERLARIESALTEPARRLENAAAILANLLSISLDAADALAQATPEQRKAQTFAVLVAQIEGIVARGPALMIFEDVHWLDPSSRELLSLIIERVPSLRLLLIVTFRPEFEPPWSGDAHVTTLLLGRLSAAERAELVVHIAGTDGLPERIVQEIARRTDGVPLFLEEMTKAVLETGLDRARLAAVAATPSLRVPATLSASLIARLDRVGSAKEIAQVAAAIGREFSYALLATIAGRPDSELCAALERLLASGLLLARGGPPDATYQFKHALIQDAAYGMLLKARRQELHAAIAAALEDRFAALAQAQPELVAYHHARAGQGPEAIRYFVKAGLLANDRSANHEAVTHLTSARELLSAIPDPSERDRVELQVTGMLAPALIATRGYGAPETVEAYERARALVHATRTYAAQSRILAGLYAVYVTRAEYEKAQDVAEECLHAAGPNDTTALCVAHRLVAVSHNISGNFAAAHDHASQAWAVYDFERHSPLAWHHAQDIGVAAGSFLSIALAQLGRFAEAAALTQTVMDLALRVGHHNTIGYAHCCAGALPAFFAGEYCALRHHASEMQVFGRTHNLPQWVSWGACLEAPALAVAGEAGCAIDKIETGLVLRERINNRYATRLIMTGAALVYLRAGQGRRALDLIDGLLASAPGTFERWTNAELWRLRGDALLATEGSGAAEVAEQAYRSAIAIAQGQGSQAYHLRAATSLARLLAECADPEHARALLEPIIAHGLDQTESADLRNAQSLLAALR